MRKILLKILIIIDPLIAILILPALIYLKLIRKFNIKNFKFSKQLLKIIGVFPIINSYYEPQFIFDEKNQNRNLSIDLNIVAQLNFLKHLKYENEINLKNFNNILESRDFCTGDIEYWYQIIRSIKPSRIIEIGSGTSTLIAQIAINNNLNEDPNYKCEYTVIDPNIHQDVLNLEIKKISKKVENTNIDYFKQLGKNDFLFIDSSHIIRPNGDVLFEYQNILPNINKGVFVHIHDIFTPNDYPQVWKYDDVKFWNEQYLLETFLTENNNWEIIAALNFLKHNYYEKLKKICPFIDKNREPGSFYIRKK